MLLNSTVRSPLTRLVLVALLLCAPALAEKVKTKASVIDQIVAMTMPSLPIELHRKLFEGVSAMAPDFVQKTMKKALADEISKDATLSEEQKSSLSGKVPDLLMRADPGFRRIIKEQFGTVESFIVSGIKADLSTLTIGEVIEVQTFLSSDAGKSYLKAVQTISQNVSSGKTKPLELQEKYAAQTSDFLASTAGKKYNDAMLGSAEGMEARIAQMMMQVFEAINKDPELDRMHKEFKASV